MRIVNQHKTEDVPYEKVAVKYDKRLNSHLVTCSVDFTQNTVGSKFLGKYESEERCIEVMENIRTAYMHDKKVFIMPEE